MHNMTGDDVYDKPAETVCFAQDIKEKRKYPSKDLNTEMEPSDPESVL